MEKVVIVCPGRGSYTKETLGYLQRFRPQFNAFIDGVDRLRAADGLPTITQLDQEANFKPALHTLGEHASTLIYAASYLDFLKLDTAKMEVVAVTGNSMGWYTALAIAQVLDESSAYAVVQTMGSMMKEDKIGGQLIYPVVNGDWQKDLELQVALDTALSEVNEQPDSRAWVSIVLGGYRVIGGNQKALDWLLKNLPKIENYPFQLVNHGAFHTPLLQGISQKALKQLPENMFRRPKIPLIDGQGRIWSPWSSIVSDIYQYTLGTQVTEVYDFTKAVTVALKEFCPDRLVLLGPGNSLGGALGQILVANHWHSMQSKAQFAERQKTNPFLLSLGRV